MSRIAGPLILAAVAAGLAALSIGLWLGEHQLSRSRDYVERLASKGWIVDEKAWHRHHSALQAMGPLVPFDSRVHWQLGELERWRAAGLRLWPARKREHLEQAKRQYMLAVLDSPNDGELLARVAYRLATLNDQLAVGLMYRAMEIAPYEPRVQFHVAAVGMRFLEALDENEKRLFETVLYHAMDNHLLAIRIWRMARNYGRGNWLKSLVGQTG